MKDKKNGKMELERLTPEMMNPFQMMRRFTKDMERVFGDVGSFTFPNFFMTDLAPFRTEFEKVGWIPQIEVLQHNGKFMVMADLPGLTKDDVKVELTGDMLAISGERKVEKDEKHEGFYRTERRYGSFYRQIPLPEGTKAEDATAMFRNGVLEIIIPMQKIEIPMRKLEIKEPIPEKAAKAATA